MRYPAVPNYSKNQINRAGKNIAKYKIGSEQYAEALEVINNWRVCHAYPINTFVATLRVKVRKTYEPIVAQRLKRLPTIIDKLERYPNMELSRMQDIAGVRGVVDTVSEIERLVSEYRDENRFTHNLVRFNDYIQNPKTDGYRGIHLVYRYHNTLARNKKAAQYEGLLLELQLRTKLQHTWATAVETMGTFRNESLKTRRGNADWLEFFALTSSSFAHLEQTPALAKYSSFNLRETFEKMRELDKKNRILEQMQGYSFAAKVIHDRKGSGGFYNLITLNTADHTVRLQSFAKGELADASNAYEAVEARAAKGEPLESVLVSVGRLRSLRQAYPNYFLDIGTFAENIEIIYSEL